MPRLEKPALYDIKQLRGIADFQFGRGSGDVLFPEDIMIERSRGTKRIKIVYLNGDRLCSFRVRDGFLVLSISGGEKLHNSKLGLRVKIIEDVEPFIRKGKSVFAKHVLEADEKISSKEEVLIVNHQDEFIGIGTAKMPGNLMLQMNSGVAVDTRKGIGEKK
ncbi:MAG: pseudouridine synthase [Candidatus Heimdallarchaeota archaeon]|nr:pseudouridine synthase [Candidatus Heimdallarchaeota archaeon]